MKNSRPFKHNLSLLALMALGNWVNTPTPPNDPNAAAAVGNSGEVRLDVDGEEFALSLQSARIAGRTLTLIGESRQGESSSVLSFEVPETAFVEGSLDIKELKHTRLTLSTDSESQLWIDSTAELMSVSAGTLSIVQATGSGPWELDGSIDLTTQEGTGTGTFQARVDV